MDPKQEVKLAYGLAIVLLIVGVISYAAFPARVPELPVRIMFQNSQGKTLFDHQTHLADTGYGISCADCHHHPPDDEEALRACTDCHLKAPSESGEPPQACLDCHEADEIEDTGMLTSKDAYHGQCAGCHADFGAGPVYEQEQCKDCHFTK